MTVGQVIFWIYVPVVLLDIPLVIKIERRDYNITFGDLLKMIGVCLVPIFNIAILIAWVGAELKRIGIFDKVVIKQTPRKDE